MAAFPIAAATNCSIKKLTSRQPDKPTLLRSAVSLSYIFFLFFKPSFLRAYACDYPVFDFLIVGCCF